MTDWQRGTDSVVAASLALQQEAAQTPSGAEHPQALAILHFGEGSPQKNISLCSKKQLRHWSSPAEHPQALCSPYCILVNCISMQFKNQGFVL